MANFVKIEHGVITDSITIDDKDILYKSFPESEKIGQNYIKKIGLDGYWLQTSENNSYRKQKAGIGYMYDFNRDVFIPPKPYPSWLLDEQLLLWYPPNLKPEDGKVYYWNENIKKWVRNMEQENILKEQGVNIPPSYEVK